MKTEIIAVTALGALAGVIAFQATSASAAPRTAAQTVAENGAYFWVDGVYEQVSLPTYRLGFHDTVAAGLAIVDAGSTQRFQPRADGGGVRAALGYAVPGAATRIEFGGSFVEGRDRQSQGTIAAIAAPLLLLTGAGADTGLNCQGVLVCPTAGILGTEYRSWQFNGKVETDWRSGMLTVTPSVVGFGGNSQVNQTLSQSIRQVNAGVPGATVSYLASTELEWRDLGARAGLHLAAALTDGLSLGIGGSIGVAARKVSFSGSDVFSSPTPLIPSANSTLTLGDSKAVLLANAEANFAFNLAPSATLHGFAGLNYDSDVPGIGAPSFGGGILAPTSRSAASIIYESQTSYYAGGGLRVSLGGARP